MPTPFNQYRNIQVTTSSPEKILIMLYDGAINFTRIAMDKLARGDVAGKGMFIGKAHAIVAELMDSLNRDVGGEVPAQLERLYIYLIDEFIAANINNNPSHLENALRIMTTMRDTWVEAAEIVRKERETGSMRSLGRVG